LSLISFMNAVRPQSRCPVPAEAGVAVAVADTALSGPRAMSAGPDYDPAADHRRQGQ
jgi:hypothetical protein